MSAVITKGIYEGYYWEDIAERDPAYVVENYWVELVPQRAYEKALDRLNSNELVDPYEDYRYAQDQARALGFVRESYDE